MIKLIKPYLSYDEIESDFREVFSSGWFTKGKYVEQFRLDIKNFTGSKHAHLTTSATTALTACLKILDIQPGDEVIVSDFSFPATANVVEDLGAIPVFADVSLDTFNMLPEELEKKITPKTKAVIFVDALGNPTGLTQIQEICTANKIPLIEDAACAIGSRENNIPCGNIADLTCFSFHPRKIINTGEGGAITTHSETYSAALDIKLNHGAIFKDGKFDFVDFGYNYRLPDLQAAMGAKQLKKISSIVKSRNLIRNEYIKLLEVAGYKAQLVGPGVIHNVQSLVFTVPQKVNRDTLIEKLKEKEIESTLGTYSLSACTYYCNKYKHIQKNSFFLQKNTITLPCYEGLNVDFVAKSILNLS